MKRLTRLLDRYVAEGRSTPGARQTNDIAVAIRTDGPRVLPSEGEYNDGKQWKHARVTDIDPKLPRVLLIGQPTRGVDIGATQAAGGALVRRRLNVKSPCGRASISAISSSE